MKIAIVGAGIAGLRAALELVRLHDVTLIEKSAGVGGRVSTRRVDEVKINHGARQFDRHQILNDYVADIYKKYFTLEPEATLLPKAMRNEFVNSGGKLILNAKVKLVSPSGVFLESGEALKGNAVILTAPVPQIHDLIGEKIFPEVTYSKEILFIGTRDSKPVVIRLPEDMAENLFDHPDEDIRRHSPFDVRDLDIKKWRFARVKSGVDKRFHQYRPNIVLAGDAFDPDKHYDIASAWESGRLSGSLFL